MILEKEKNMKHAMNTLKNNEFQDDIEYDSSIEEGKFFLDRYKLLRFLVNVPVIFIIYYLYNRYVLNINQSIQSIKNVANFIFIIGSIYFIVSTNYILWKKTYKLEKLFLIIMVPVSLIYSLVILPGMVPDEATHMRLTYSLASQIMGVEKDKVTVRAEEKYIHDKMPQGPNIADYEYTYSHLLSKESNGKYVTIDSDSANWKQIFGYFPAVIGVIFSRTMLFGATPTLYVARYCNLFFYLWLTYFAIKKIPIGKQLMFMISLLPMCSQQMMSLSYDTVLNSATFFCLAYGLFFIYNNDEVRIDEYIKYLFSAILLLTIKSAVYSFILLIPLLSRFKINSENTKIETRQKIILFISIVIFILLLNFISFGNKTAVSVDSTQASTTTKHIISWCGLEGYSISWLISHPLDGISLFIRTIVIKGRWYYYSCLGQDLCWLNVKLPNVIFDFWGVFLILSALKKEKNTIDKRLRILFTMISIVVFFLVLLSMCIFWTPLIFDHIEGVQGRYFIPIVYTILIIINNQKICIKADLYKYINIFASMLTLISIMNLLSVCFV